MTRPDIKAEEITIKLYDPFSQFEEVKKIWTDLLAKCPHSFFLSWGWKEVWLKSLPKDSNLSLMVGHKNKKPIFAFFIGAKKNFRYGLIKIHMITLNATSIKSIDRLTIEYNAILMDPKITLSLETLIELMPFKNWNEFHFPYIALNYFPKFEINNNHKYNLQKTNIPSYYVDLKKVRDADMDYLSLLSSRRQNRLGRSLKKYEEKGKVQAHAANSADEAWMMFQELKKLHLKRMAKIEKRGIFTQNYFCDFHRNLIESRFEKNEIQLLHVTCGQDTIGYLYSFLYNGQLLGYQGGFNYPQQTVYLPGMTCHYMAVIYNAEKGLDTYDFLAGDDHYKKTLSTDSAEMQHVLVQKNKIQFAIEKKLKRIYRSLRNLRNQN